MLPSSLAVGSKRGGEFPVLTCLPNICDWDICIRWVSVLLKIIRGVCRDGTDRVSRGLLCLYVCASDIEGRKGTENEKPRREGNVVAYLAQIESWVCVHL